MGHKLTDTQARIISLLREGYNRAEIATELDLSEDTVRTYIRRLCTRFGGVSQHELAAAVESTR